MSHFLVLQPISSEIPLATWLSFQSSLPILCCTLGGGSSCFNYHYINEALIPLSFHVKERQSACPSTSVWSGIVQTSHSQAATSPVQKHNMPPAYSRQPDQGQMFLWFYCTFGLDWWAIIRQNGQSAILPSSSLWHSFLIENHLICFNLKHGSVRVPSQTLNRSIFISS